MYEPLSSTQQAGKGDAYIFGRSSSSIDNLLNIVNAQKQQRDNLQINKELQQNKYNLDLSLENKKTANENKQTYYKTLNSSKLGIWDADMPEISNDISAIVEKTSEYIKNGKDPFNPENSAEYAEIQGMLMQLESKKAASINAYNQYEDAYNAVNGDKNGMYDKLKFLEAANTHRNMSITDRSNTTLFPPLATPNLVKIIKDDVDGIVKNQLKNIVDVYDNKGNYAEATTQKAALLDAIPAYVNTALAPLIDAKRITQEQADKTVENYIALLQADPMYSPIADAKLEIARRNANTAARNADTNAYNATTKRIGTNNAVQKTKQGTNAQKMIEDAANKETVAASTFSGIPYSYEGVSYTLGNIEKRERNEKSVTLYINAIDGEGNNKTFKFTPIDRNGNFAQTALYGAVNNHYLKNKLSYNSEIGANQTVIEPQTATFASLPSNTPKTSTTTQTTTPKTTEQTPSQQIPEGSRKYEVSKGGNNYGVMLYTEKQAQEVRDKGYTVELVK